MREKASLSSAIIKHVRRLGGSVTASKSKRVKIPAFTARNGESMAAYTVPAPIASFMCGIKWPMGMTYSCDNFSLHKLFFERENFPVPNPGKHLFFAHFPFTALLGTTDKYQLVVRLDSDDPADPLVYVRDAAETDADFEKRVKAETGYVWDPLSKIMENLEPDPVED